VPDGVTVSLSAASFAPGEYEVILVGTSHAHSCRIALPAVEGDSAYCSSEFGHLELSEDGASLVSVSQYEFSPDTVDVIVQLDGVVLHEESVEPAYADEEPNGEGCGFTSYGSASVAW
jgi:hypothetical protein